MAIKMNRFLLCASLAVIGSTVSPAVADEWNKETKLTFSVPVEVPGKVLDPGKYVFRLLDSSSDRNIVQIFSEDDEGNQKLITTLLAVPDYRLNTPDKTIVQFEERKAGSPEAIKSWFYPGDNAGWHFVYPKSEQLGSAVIAASVSPAPPPAPQPPALTLDPPPSVELVSQTDPIIVEDEQVAVARFEPAPEPEVPLPAELPKTASDSGMILLAAVTLMGAGLLAVSWSLSASRS
jgi:hypothetical protein